MVLAGQAGWNVVPGGKVVNGEYQLKCGEGSGWQKCGEEAEKDITGCLLNPEIIIGKNGGKPISARTIDGVFYWVLRHYGYNNFSSSVPFIKVGGQTYYAVHKGKKISKIIPSGPSGFIYSVCRESTSGPNPYL